MNPLRLLLRVLLAATGLLATAGCLAVKTVTMPVKLAARTVMVAGETAGTAVATTGRVAVAAMNTTGAVTAGSLEAAAALSEAGMVTFVDVATGTIVRVPWEEGMNLHAGSTVAKVRTAQRALDLIRAGRAVYSAMNYDNRASILPLQPGDVIRLAPGK